LLEDDQPNLRKGDVPVFFKACAMVVIQDDESKNR
jgi:hypothetical protein